MPAYNAAKTIQHTLASIPQELNAKILVVDDASTDETVSIVKKLGVEVIQHQKNCGYGGNQKTCYTHALKTEADIIVMLHPDDQYDSRLIPALILPIELGICDIMLGNRIRSRKEALEGGMPLYKYMANRLLTILENLLLGQNLGEFHSGMRAYDRKVLETIPWELNSNQFVFDEELLIQSAFLNFKIGDIPVPVKYFKEASSISFVNSVIYGLATLKMLLFFAIARWFAFPLKRFSPKYS